MKKFLFILLTTISMSSVAQESVTDKDYIFSPNGFVVKEFQHPDGSGVSRGLYTADGKTFIKAFVDAKTKVKGKGTPFYVAPKTEIIAENSIRIYATGQPIFIPQSVKYISAKAFSAQIDPSTINAGWNIHIYDDKSYTSQDEKGAFHSTNDNIKELTTSTSK